MVGVEKIRRPDDAEYLDQLIQPASADFASPNSYFWTCWKLISSASPISRWLNPKARRRILNLSPTSTLNGFSDFIGEVGEASHSGFAFLSLTPGQGDSATICACGGGPSRRTFCRSGSKTGSEDRRLTLP